MSDQKERSEEIFNALNQKKKKRRRKVILTVLIVVLVVALALGAGVFYLRQQVDAQFASELAEVLSYEVTTGTISTVVSGSGTLTQVDLESLTVPAGVDITEITVSAGDTVETGDVLATVDMSSVMTALADLQAELDDLDDEISDAKGDEVSSTITAGISGRVKLLYAESGTDVSACMAENGALAVLSLDGYMAVDIQTDALSRGDTVTVILDDGEEYTGTVESAVNGSATILLTDNGPAYGQTATVYTEGGSEAGSGTLYIHSPLSITGYAGTVSRVYVSENTKVYSTTTLFYLTDTSFSANYDTLLRNRETLEEELLELLTIYRDGAVLSPMDGMVSSIDYTSSSATGSATSLLTLYPNISMSVTIGVDETDILSLEVGQEAEVVVSSVSDDTLTGVVTEISQEASTSTGVTQYSAVITLDKVDGMLAGMTASVDVKIEGVDDALIIPLEALHQTSAIYYVYTSYDEESGEYGGMVEVTTGMQNSSYVEILSGLSEGDTVYYTEETTTFSFGGMGNFSGSSDFSGGFSNDSGNMRDDMGGRGNMGGMDQGGQP